MNEFVGGFAAGTQKAASGIAVAALRAAAIRKWRPSRSTLLLIGLGVLVVLVSTWLLVRNSKIVAVEQVRVVGLDGHYDKGARKAVIAEAMTMTTMNVSEGDLRDAVGQYLDVAGIRTDSDYPHKLTIFVSVRRPVAVIKTAGGMFAVTGEGLVLEGSRSLSTLPSVDAGTLIRDDHVTDAKTKQALTILGAAPDVLLRRVKKVEWQKRGLVLTIEKGVKLFFGDAADAAAKWRAAAAVLASAEAKGASYIDLRVPGRPSLGGLGAAPVTQKPALEESLQNEPGADSASSVPAGTDQANGQLPAGQAPTGQNPAPQQPVTSPGTPVTQQAPAQTTPVSPGTP